MRAVGPKNGVEEIIETDGVAITFSVATDHAALAVGLK